ncbi:MAG TPA: AbrB family transcriptional regulator, partial [Roseiarcus sp.]|nr:AbrB family transcriptional regulator [Roseiarcus sp.]
MATRSSLAPENRMSPFTLRQTPPALQWAALLVASVVWVAAFEWMRLPAALMLGAITAAILLCWFEGRVTIPPWGFVIAQGFVGCLVARAITPDIVVTIFHRWPMFLVLIGAVIFFAALLGYGLARLRVLPGTTAVWGSSAGAATAMVLMSDGFGGDMRLVAVMQYLRVACVGLVASLVARAWAPGAATAASIIWSPPVAPGPLLATLLLGVGGAIVGMKCRIPAGALLVPMFIGAPLSATHLITITLPPWLLAISYALVGWSIGLRFTREAVLHASKQLPIILASILALIAMCGGLAFALHEAAGTDPLTAYLATSPGGADAVAIIAASSPV